MKRGEWRDNNPLLSERISIFSLNFLNLSSFVLIVVSLDLVSNDVTSTLFQLYPLNNTPIVQPIPHLFKNHLMGLFLELELKLLRTTHGTQATILTFANSSIMNAAPLTLRIHSYGSMKMQSVQWLKKERMFGMTM